MNPTRPETAPGLAYEGRPLPRPGAEIVDQGLSFDVGTLFSRRRVLSALGLGAGVVALAACGVGTSSGGSSSGGTSSGGTSTGGTSSAGGPTEIPDETAGPFPGDGSNGPDALEQSGIVRSDLRTSFGTGSKTAEGVPLTIELDILDLANGAAAFSGVAVYAWHCDRDGNYSMYSSGLENENYLRGVQVADAAGKVRFTSIFPATYSGRWPHVHFEIYPDAGSISDSTKTIATSQLAFPREVCDEVYATDGYQASVAKLAQLSLETDNVFGDDGGVHQLAMLTGDVTKGYGARLTVPVDTRTAPTGGGPGGGGPGGGGPGGGPPSGAPPR